MGLWGKLGKGIKFSLIGFKGVIRCQLVSGCPLPFPPGYGGLDFPFQGEAVFGKSRDLSKYLSFIAYLRVEGRQFHF